MAVITVVYDFKGKGMDDAMLKGAAELVAVHVKSLKCQTTASPPR